MTDRYETLADHLVHDGGFTDDRATRTYVVGIDKASERTFHLGPETRMSEVADFIYTYVVNVAANGQFGGWRDGDTLVLDRIASFDNYQLAIAAARYANQAAIYNQDTGTVLSVD